MLVSKPVLYAIGAFSGILVLWAVTNVLMAVVLSDLGIILRSGVVEAYYWLLMADWAIGLVVAAIAAWCAYRHFSD